MPRGYIAGPMRGIKDFNFPAFDRAADKGRKLGHDIISPADLDRESGVHETTSPDFQPADIRSFVQRDVGALLDLRAEDGDFIALLPNWHASTGARAEYYVAKWLGLAIYDAETFHPLEVVMPTRPTAQYVRPPVLNNYRESCYTGMCGTD